MSIIVKDANSVDRYYETVGDGSSSNPFQSVVPDYKLAHAIRQIKNSDGVDVSIWEKGKSLSKFGLNSDLDTGVAETIWETGGDETLKTANDIDVIVSSNAGDTQDVVIEGHTISGTDLTFVVQTVALNGTTNVSLTTPLARVTRAYNNNSTNFAGTITIKDNGTSTHLTINGAAGQNQSRKCQTSLSSADYFIVTELSGGVVGSTSATVKFQFQTKAIGKVWRTQRSWNSSTFTEVKLNPPLIVPPNSDVRIIGTSGTNNTEAIAVFAGYLAIIT
jgi:hypothetical protein